jgi:23S rRNA (pseudouridine1915-N3)-methyltransferase
VKISIVAIGHKQPTWAGAAVNDFLSRFPADFKVELKELKAEPRSARSDTGQRSRAAEAVRLRAALPSGTTVVALDERGRDCTTSQLAEMIERWRANGESVAFVIGGPDGLDEQFKQQAAWLLRLSSLTLPHALARVVLAEQLYRAWSIIARHPYHRA